MRLPPISSLLWRKQRVYQVFGANTDVGKTIFTTMLCNGAKKVSDEQVAFLKPVSTGSADESDSRCKSTLSARLYHTHIRETNSPPGVHIRRGKLMSQRPIRSCNGNL